LAHAVPKTKSPSTLQWQARIAQLYGDLAGQRGLARDEDTLRYLAGHGDGSLPDLIVALQTYFVLVCDLFAVARLTAGSSRTLVHLSSLPDPKFRDALEQITSADIYRTLGVLPAVNPLPFDWYTAELSRKELDLVRAVFALVESCNEALSALPPHADVMQLLYARIMPRNLLHILGEFYTPPWLAELLLQDVGWNPSKRLLDPYAGSGVVLVAAINESRRLGFDCQRLLGNLAAIDLNPAAYAATRTNLILALVPALGKDRSEIRLPILCADSLLPNPVSQDAARSPFVQHASPGRLREPIAAPFLPRADCLVTNPPWVGWEYMPRGYRTRLNSAWKHYGLFTARGRDAAFLKEDLSTLALVAAWDRYLVDGGRSAVVVRPASMQSHLAARGLRRLSIYPDSGPLCLRQIRDLDSIRPFAGTLATAAAWILEKGSSTTFPVPVSEWRPRHAGWQPGLLDTLAEVRANVTETTLAATRSDPADSGSPWTIGPLPCQRATAALRGSNDYQVRTGVFTGGANAVYYLEPLSRPAPEGLGWFRNIVARAKREAAPMEVQLEKDLVYEIVRGRDLQLWHPTPGSLLLCPHTEQTRMRAIPHTTLRRSYPRAFSYLQAMKPVLDARKGFSGWERHLRDESFYAIQRIGSYSFSPYKTAWRYIATDFIVAVVGPDPNGRPRLCNDKVMYVGFREEWEAYYLCGLLSSDPIRWCVTSTMTGTQISTSAIRHLVLPPCSENDPRHRKIAECCHKGHEARSAGRSAAAEAELETIQELVAELYDLPTDDREVIRADLASCPL
jgi:hypothetical protein